MINFKNSIGKIVKEIKANRCALVLVSAGVCMTSTGCVITIEVPDNFIDNFNISSDENGNYSIKYNTDETKVFTTDSSITDVIHTSTSPYSTTSKTLQTTTKTNYTSPTITDETETVINSTITTEIETTTANQTTNAEIETVITNPTLPVVTSQIETINTIPTNPSTTTETISVKKTDYSLNYGYGEYKVQKGDTLTKISDMTGFSVEKIMSFNNLSSSDIYEGQYLAVPALIVYYHITSDKNISEISYLTGVTKEELCRLNGVDESFVFTPHYSIVLSNLFGGQTSYDTLRGKANIINNTVIIGDKIIQKNNIVIALQHGINGIYYNEVVSYSFDSNNNFTTKHLFSNVKDIDLVNDIPVAYIRTKEDIDNLMKLAEIYGYLVSETSLATNTNNSYNYSIYTDYNSDMLYTYDNNQYDFNKYDEESKLKNYSKIME